MRRDQALAKLPQLAAQINAYKQKRDRAEKAGDMTAWDDARRNIIRLEAKKAQLIQQYH